MSRHEEITRLLASWREGDQEALEQVSDLVYRELKRLARGQMASERPGHTLQTTALVNEAVIGMMGADIDYQDRNHFMVVAARMMRRILIDHARSRQRDKRGRGVQPITLKEDLHGAESWSADILALDVALNRLAEFDERKARIIEGQHFAGFSIGQLADLLGVSQRTVERDAQLARAWLAKQLNTG